MSWENEPKVQRALMSIKKKRKEVWIKQVQNWRKPGYYKVTLVVYDNEQSKTFEMPREFSRKELFSLGPDAYRQSLPAEYQSLQDNAFKMF